MERLGKNLNRNYSPRYQQELAEQSCSTYNPIQKHGSINSSHDQEKIDYMFNKNIKMVLIDDDLSVFLLTQEGEVYHWGNIRQFNNIVEYYSQLFDLRYTRIVQAAVSKQTFIILTDDDKVS
ncbi:PREDICTED: uncharacterized protein LOC108777082 [Cyphomyrmex costatus]|uniref:uncharacterized protein LOC108777082 n=1 Tax=Cyphomyrmex costatus TaxID=456900 RepID=UPI00085231EB|nr:PREDICTED: uncharacterized protein LOC108777082 [Cyphomyrmex costatus]